MPGPASGSLGFPRRRTKRPSDNDSHSGQGREARPAWALARPSTGPLTGPAVGTADQRGVPLSTASGQQAQGEDLEALFGLVFLKANSGMPY